MNRFMNAENRGRMHQQGIALVFALLLLLLLTVIGIGTMSSVRMQERMAGNANLQSLAFHGASAAVTETLDWGFDTGNWAQDGDGNPLTCQRGADGSRWFGEWSGWATLDVPEIPAGFKVQHRKRVGCFADPGWTLLDGIDPDDVPQQLLALGVGEVVRTSDDEVVARREIEVRLEERGGGDPTCLIQTGCLNVVDIRMPDSNSFRMDGRPLGDRASSCPIKVAPSPTPLPSGAEEMMRQLRDGGDRTGNYLPPPAAQEGPLDGAWGDEVTLARAVNAMKVGIRGADLWPTSAGANAFSACGTGTSGNDNTIGTSRLFEGNQDWSPGGPGFNPCGDLGKFDVTYVAGDLEVAGNCRLRGQIIVEGGLSSSGNPSYTGDILVLGGVLDVNGFGNAANSGLLIVQNLRDQDPSQSAQTAYDPSDVRLECGSFRIGGGGGATIRPLECDEMQGNWARLNQCIASLEQMVVDEETWNDPNGNPITGSRFDFYQETIPALSVLDDLQREDIEGVRFPIPDCEGDGAGEGRRLAIASWREFIDPGRWDDN